MTSTINREIAAISSPPRESAPSLSRAPALAGAMTDWTSGKPAAEESARVIGVLPGEGVGPEVIAAAVEVLKAAEERFSLNAKLQFEGPIGVEAEIKHGHSLTPQVERFCEDVFASGGAILCGPGGNRFVYNLRRRFDLYCKFTPIQPTRAIDDAGTVRPEVRAGVDMIIVRENIGGIYFGSGDRRVEPDRGEIATLSFSYSKKQVQRIVEVAARLAMQRAGKLCMALKPNGVPAISEIWS